MCTTQVAKVTIIVKTPIHRLDQLVNNIIAVNDYLEQTEVFVLFGQFSNIKKADSK